jgi:hypothetical protein
MCRHARASCVCVCVCVWCVWCVCAFVCTRTHVCVFVWCAWWCVYACVVCVCVCVCVCVYLCQHLCQAHTGALCAVGWTTLPAGPRLLSTTARLSPLPPAHTPDHEPPSPAPCSCSHRGGPLLADVWQPAVPDRRERMWSAPGLRQRHHPGPHKGAPSLPTHKASAEAPYCQQTGRLWQSKGQPLQQVLLVMSWVFCGTPGRLA